MVCQLPQQLRLQGIRGWMALTDRGDVLQKRTICCPAGIRIPDCPTCGRAKIHSTVAIRLPVLRFFAIVARRHQYTKLVIHPKFLLLRLHIRQNFTLIILLFLFTIMGNMVPLSDFSLPDPFSDTN